MASTSARTVKRATTLGALMLLVIAGCQPRTAALSGPGAAHAAPATTIAQSSSQPLSLTEGQRQPQRRAKTRQRPKPVGIAPALKLSGVRQPLPDFAAIPSTAERKRAFFNYLKPIIDAENAQIERWRKYLKRLQQQLHRHGELHPDDQAWLSRLATLNRYKGEQPSADIPLLLQQIDRIPAALALAQAANESAWGTSRFAREGNNLFGMWCFKPGCGIRPRQRPAGARYEVAAFDSVEAGVRRYVINLNSNRSYRKMRNIRGCLKSQQNSYSGRALAAGLTQYSARGGHYVKELRAMIRVNELEQGDQNWCGKRQTEHPCYRLVQVTVKKPDPLKAQKKLPIKAAKADAGNALANVNSTD